MVALGLTGVLGPREALSGFSDSAVVTMAAVFVLVAGLQVTGVTNQPARFCCRVAGNHEHRLLITVMALGALLSLVMNDLAAAVLLPAVSRPGRRTHIQLSRLLMPLAFATILGGMATLFTTSNLIISSTFRGQGLPGSACSIFCRSAGRWRWPASSLWRWLARPAANTARHWKAAAPPDSRLDLVDVINWASGSFGRVCPSARR